MKQKRVSITDAFSLFITSCRCVAEISNLQSRRYVLFGMLMSSEAPTMLH